MTAIDDTLPDDHLLEAIAELTAANRVERDPGREQLLAELRYRAWSEVQPSPRAEWPGHHPDHFADVDGLPDVDYADLDAELLGSAIEHHSGLIVRNLFTEDQCRSLNQDIDRTLESLTARFEGRVDQVDPAWYTQRPGEGPDFELGGRVWLHRSGTVWTGESPRTLYDLIEVLEDRHLDDLLTAYLGERPAISLIKCAMRRVSPPTASGWHQDGHVLGRETRVLNVWVATSPCGAVAPGLDVLTRPMHSLATTKSPPPMDFIVDDETVAELTPGYQVVRPEFGPGDGMIFDQYLLHRTARGEFDQSRYGFECWFFAPSTFPLKWVPIVL